MAQGLVIGRDTGKVQGGGYSSLGGTPPDTFWTSTLLKVSFKGIFMAHSWFQGKTFMVRNCYNGMRCSV